jgi:hypothetical protein
MQVGTVEERILYPKHIYTDKTRAICVDECIADVVLHLWERGVVTYGSCCGHNGLIGKPSIIIDDNASIAMVKQIRAVIKEVDNREFEIFSSTLLSYSEGDDTPVYVHDINRELKAEQIIFPR